MNDLILEYQREKQRKNHVFDINSIISKILLSIIFLLVSIILINKNENIRKFYEDKVFNDSLSFIKFNDLYNKYFGSITETYSPDELVFNENIQYTSIADYLNGKELTVTSNYLVPSIGSGIIVYLGNKDDLGNTCIIQGVDGVDIWYSNIDTSNLTLYDYINKGDMLGPTLSDKLYLTLEKDNEFIDYETY